MSQQRNRTVQQYPRFRHSCLFVRRLWAGKQMLWPTTTTVRAQACAAANDRRFSPFTCAKCTTHPSSGFLRVVDFTHVCTRRSPFSTTLRTDTRGATAPKYSRRRPLSRVEEPQSDRSAVDLVQVTTRGLTVNLRTRRDPRPRSTVPSVPRAQACRRRRPRL